MGDYAIWTETAEFARGNRPDFFRAVAQRRRAGAPRRRHLPGARPQSRDARVARARSRRPVQEYEIPPDPELLAAIKQARDVRPARTVNTDSVRGIVQRARGPALFAVRPIFDSTGSRPAAGLDRLRARVHARGRRAHGPLLAVAGHRLPGGEPRSLRRARRGARVGAPVAAHREPADARRRDAGISTAT